MTVLVLLAALAACGLADLCVAGWWRISARRDPAVRRLERHLMRRVARRQAAREILARFDRRLLRTGASSSLERRLREAGIPLAVSEAGALAAAGTLVLGGVAAAAGGVEAAAIVVTACPCVGWWALGAMRDRRIRRLDLQLPAALDLLVGQLRAHRSAAEAISEVARGIGDPLRSECARVAEEMRLGVPLPQALDALRRRIPSRPLGAAVTAILVAEKTGGNLADFLARQSVTVRAHVAFLQEVRAVTAHARSTATILTLLPVGVTAGLLLLNPGFLSPMLRTGLGRELLGSAAAMEVVGWQVIRAMIRSAER